MYHGYRGPLIQNFGYDQFPPTANGWGTIHPVSENASAQQPEEGGTNLKRTNPENGSLLHHMISAER
jgi:hypothetical protein